MREQAANQLENARVTLAEILRLFEDTEFQLELLSAQDAWARYADLNVRLVSGLDRPSAGTLAPLRAMIHERLMIEARVKQLQGFCIELQIPFPNQEKLQV